MARTDAAPGRRRSAPGVPETAAASLPAEWRRWRDNRPPARNIHLDSAAAGRCSTAALQAAAAHAEREAVAGAYVAQAEAEPVLEAGRASLAGLLGVPAGGLAFTESATAALTALLPAWPLRAGDTVAVVPSEWGPNLAAFAHRGLRITELATRPDGTVDLGRLERFLAGTRPAFVHLTQVASHPPGPAGRRSRAAVPRRGCSAVGRRRTSARPRRHRLRGGCGVRDQPQMAGGPPVVDGTGSASAITALRPANGQDVVTTRARLLAEHAIVTTASIPARAPREMTGPTLRISPHVDCTAGDLDLLRTALAGMASQ